MDIDTLTTDDLMNLIEGYFCYPTESECTSHLQNTLLALIEWHETSDEDLMAGLTYFRDNGPRVCPPKYDAGFRNANLFG
jgi:hypothetical protein